MTARTFLRKFTILRYTLTEMATIYYSDPLFDELYSQISEESKRSSAYSFAIAARISEILCRKGWSKTDFARAMGKKEPEISKWMSGQHNFTIATIAKIEAALGEDILSVKKYRKNASGYSRTTKAKRRFLSEQEKHKYGKDK